MANETGNDTLKDSEPHPAAVNALNWLRNNYPKGELLKWQEAFASSAIEGNRLAEVCLGTVNRLLKDEPVSDRYLLGLVWVLRYEDLLKRNEPKA